MMADLALAPCRSWRNSSAAFGSLFQELLCHASLYILLRPANANRASLATHAQPTWHSAPDTTHKRFMPRSRARHTDPTSLLVTVGGVRTISPRPPTHPHINQHRRSNRPHVPRLSTLNQGPPPVHSGTKPRTHRPRYCTVAHAHAHKRASHCTHTQTDTACQPATRYVYHTECFKHIHTSSHHSNLPCALPLVHQTFTAALHAIPTK